MEQQEKFIQNGSFFPKHYYKTMPKFAIDDDLCEDILENELVLQDSQSESMSQVEFMSISALTRSVVSKANIASSFIKKMDQYNNKINSPEKIQSNSPKNCVRDKADSQSNYASIKKSWLSHNGLFQNLQTQIYLQNSQMGLSYTAMY